jgi:NitT/TauT family transport system substrate-binding protein
MHQLITRRSWFLLALIAAIALLFVLSIRAGWLAPSAPPILRFAYDRFPGSLPALLAEKLGYLQNSSCSVELVMDNEHMQTNSRFAAGFYSGMATTIGSAVASSSFVSEQRIAYIKDDSRGADVFLADKSIKKLADLKGKRIGALVGDFGEFWLDHILGTVGLEISDVEVLPSDGSLIPQLLAAGTIHAGHTWTPYAEQGIALGQKVLANTIDEEFVLVDVIVFRKEAMAHFRPCIKEFLSAWSRAVDYWRAHPSDAEAILGQALGQEAKSFSLNGIKLFNIAENVQIMGSPQMRAVVEANAHYFQKRGVTIPRNVHDQLLDPTLVNELSEARP